MRILAPGGRFVTKHRAFIKKVLFLVKKKSACGNVNQEHRAFIKKVLFGVKKKAPAAKSTRNTGLLKVKISKIIVTLLGNHFHMGRYGLILGVSEAYIDLIAFGTSFDPISAYIKFKNPKHIKNMKNPKHLYIFST